MKKAAPDLGAASHILRYGGYDLESDGWDGCVQLSLDVVCHCLGTVRYGCQNGNAQANDGSSQDNPVNSHGTVLVSSKVLDVVQHVFSPQSTFKFYLRRIFSNRPLVGSIPALDELVLAAKSGGHTTNFVLLCSALTFQSEKI